eukprot:7391767-Prymnesium_polylepis.1
MPGHVFCHWRQCPCPDTHCLPFARARYAAGRCPGEPESRPFICRNERIALVPQPCVALRCVLAMPLGSPLPPPTFPAVPVALSFCLVKMAAFHSTVFFNTTQMHCHAPHGAHQFRAHCLHHAVLSERVVCNARRVQASPVAKQMSVVQANVMQSCVVRRAQRRWRRSVLSERVVCNARRVQASP